MNASSCTVVRVSRATFHPGRFAAVDAVNKKISEYLIPAIKRLPGFIHFYAGVSPEGSAAHVSVWDTNEHGTPLDPLTEMTLDARGEAEAAGATFTPIVNYPVGWTMLIIFAVLAISYAGGRAGD
jgi:hypothetical protein